MIITQTPFRISFAGGGTDLPAFYRNEWGAVLSTALKRHMYVTVHTRFEHDVRVSYSKTEIAREVDAIRHELVREAMRATGTGPPLEVTTVADVPAGTGLGSSSTLTVGLLNALNAHRGRVTGRAELAAEACRIEIEVLGHPIGKQDQYAAAYGGINYVRFEPDGTVHVEPVLCAPERRREIEQHSIMAYTGQRRSASDILEKQSAGTGDRMPVLRAMRDIAGAMRDVLGGSAPLTEFGRLLDEGWQLKRSLGFGIATSDVDAWYAAARAAGAWGGKLLGAGGGGFVYLLAPPERHAAILDALGRPQTLPVEFDPAGSRIVFVSDS